MKKIKGNEVSYAKYGYLFIAPFFIAFLIFQFIPLIQTIYYSFFEYYRSGLTIIGPTPVGLDNYKELFNSDFLSNLHLFSRNLLGCCLFFCS